MNDQEKVNDFLTRVEYMVLAVTLADDSPWAVPVRLRLREGNIFEWDSKLDTLHSHALSEHPSIAVTLFEKTEKTQFGVYAVGEAKLVEAKEHGLGRYRFVAEKIWINDETFQKREVELS